MSEIFIRFSCYNFTIRRGRYIKHYSVLPVDWDYKHSKEIKEFNDKEIWTPNDIEEVVRNCGSLFPFITKQTNAIAYARGVKKKFPFIKFALMEGKTFGELELVKEF